MLRPLAAVLVAAVASAQTEIIVGTSTYGYAPLGSFIYYKFQYASAPNYTVTLSRVGSTGDPDLFVTLNQNYFEPWTGTVRSSGSSSSLDSVTMSPSDFGLMTIPSGTWIYVTVKGYATASYYLNVTGGGLPPGPVPTPSSSPLPAQWLQYPSLTFATTVNAQIVQNASDYYRFVMPSAAYGAQSSLKIRVNCTGSAFGADVNLYAALEGPNNAGIWAVANGIMSNNPAAYQYEELVIPPGSAVWPSQGQTLFIRIAGVGSLTNYAVAVTQIPASASAAPTPASTPSASPGFLTMLSLGFAASGTLAPVGTKARVYVFYAPYVQQAYRFTVSARQATSTSSITTAQYTCIVSKVPPPCLTCTAMPYTFMTDPSTLSLTASSSIVTTGVNDTLTYNMPWYIQLLQTGGSAGIAFTLSVEAVAAATPSPTRGPTSFVLQSVMSYTGSTSLSAEGGLTFTMALASSQPAFVTWNPLQFVGYNISAAYGTWVIALAPINGDVDLDVSETAPACSSCFRSTYSSALNSLSVDTVRVTVHNGNYNQQWAIRAKPYTSTATGATVSIYRSQPGNGVAPSTAATATSSSKSGVAAGAAIGAIVFIAIIAVVIFFVIKNNARAKAVSSMSSSQPGTVVVALPGQQVPTTVAPMVVTNPVPVQTGAGYGGQGMSYIPGEMPPAGSYYSNPLGRPAPQPGGVPTYGAPVNPQPYGMPQQQAPQGYGMPQGQQGYGMPQAGYAPAPVGYGVPMAASPQYVQAQPQPYANGGMLMPAPAPTSFAPQPTYQNGGGAAPPAYNAAATPSAGATADPSVGDGVQIMTIGSNGAVQISSVGYASMSGATVVTSGGGVTYYQQPQGVQVTTLHM